MHHSCHSLSLGLMSKLCPSAKNVPLRQGRDFSGLGTTFSENVKRIRVEEGLNAKSAE